VSEKWSESAFFDEFAPSVQFNDSNQKITQNRLCPSTPFHRPRMYTLQC